MKSLCRAIPLFLLAASAAVLAADAARVVKVAPGMPVSLYGDAQGKAKVAEMPASELAARLPLAVIEENDAYVEVALDSRKVWIDSEQVTISRSTATNCDAVRSTMGGMLVADAGISRGAGPKSNPCAKAK